MKPKLVEVDFCFHSPTEGGHDHVQFTVRAGLLRNKLNISFSIAGEASRDLPGSLIENIRKSLEYAAKHIRAQDLTEYDPEPEEDC